VFKKLILASILWMLPLTMNFFQIDVNSGLVYAEKSASKSGAASRKQKTRKVPAMREKTYKTIAEAQLFIEAENPAEAIPILQKLLSKRGLNVYEVAQTWNMLAFAYYIAEDNENTINAYEQVLKQGKITLALELGTLRSLFQLYYQAEEYKKSIAYIDRWLSIRPV
jgi:tetratricopeptide (TPR) repeat protein